jgi:mannose-1-phosphate guanylyltransferase/mannose-6-phosphate isomerase
MSLVVPVILSGGSGSRLWPKSRQFYPKQFHRLYGDYTMVQHTLHRVSHLGKPIVVCNQDQRFMVADQLQAISIDADIVLEPVARNTAPAIAVSALRALQLDPDAIIAVFAADHLIENQVSFRQSLDEAVRLAAEGKLVTFGVVPVRPETGYGYLKVDSPDKSSSHPVEAFVEKPNRKLAEQYLSTGCYFWNSGMFVFSAQHVIDELRLREPELVEACHKSLLDAKVDLDFLRLDAAAFASCPSISIDYALMEKTDSAWMVPLDAGWSDLGSWDAIWEVAPKDEAGNFSEGDVIVEDCHNCFVMADTRLVTLLGLENVAVIETADGVLVVNKSRSQDVKNIVGILQRRERPEYSLHREVYRPWGCYDRVDQGPRYKVNKVTVKPGASMAIQKHHHRAEHWVVVAGTALAQVDGVEVLVTENQSIYVPIGQKHTVTNPGKIPLVLVEVQTGSYLGDDDVQRL